MSFYRVEGLELLEPDWPAPARVRSAVTTRRGGVSTGVWASLNVATHVNDDPDNVYQNRALLRDALGLPAEPVWLTQVHGTSVVDLSDEMTGYEADAAVAREPGRVCVMMTADCLPVLFCDRAGSSVGAAHAGWRGLLDGVLENTVQAMVEEAGSLMAWLGPAIGPDAFEVGAEVRDAFVRRDAAAGHCFMPAPERGKYFADLYALGRQRLEALNVQVYGGGLCTHKDSQRFFSYRRDGECGRMASLVWLQP